MLFIGSQLFGMTMLAERLPIPVAIMKSMARFSGKREPGVIPDSL
jgi:hypothetical protein